MNKKVIYSILILSAGLIICLSQRIYSQNVGSSASINVNNIYLPFDNNGVIADVYIPGNYTNGYYENHEFLFSAGFWLSGYTENELWANRVTSEFSGEDYQPGIVGMAPYDPQASLYRVGVQDPPFGQSWQDWSDAVSMGADFYDGDGDGAYNPVDLNGNNQWDPDEDKPDIIGDESYWCVYNDGVPANQRQWGSEPQGIEIRQTVFAFASSSGSQSNTVFIRYRIKNTGTVADTLKDIYFGNYSDADIGEANGFEHNYVGCDTLRNASYTYMKDPSPYDWGDNPPAYMTDLLTGPLSYIPGVTFDDVNGNNVYDEGTDIPLDTAYSFRGPLGVPIYPGAMNLDLTSAIFFVCPALCSPENPQEALNNILGLLKTGDALDPCTWGWAQVFGGVPCSEVNPYYWCSGDPVSNTGWVSVVDADVKNVQSTGPFKLVKNKEIEILLGYEVGRGDSPLNSVSVVGNVSDDIQDFYENNFGYPYVLGVKDENINKPDFSLSQNYPNPFNPMTTIKYEIGNNGLVQLKVYDILGKEVETLVNESQTAGSHTVQFNGRGLSSGVYFYQLKAGKFIETRKLILIK